MTGRLAVLVAGSLLAGLILVSAPAQAAPTRMWADLAVSREGRVWTEHLTRPIFATSTRWVPGDVRTRRFFARNQSGEDARLSVAVRVFDRTAWLSRGALRMFLRVDGRWRRITFAGRTGVGNLRVRAGEVVPVIIRIRMWPSATAVDAQRSMRFVVKLRLTEERR
ncbi:hypothetical protein [Nocardioides sp. cx-173]|uniref:hypothetical protein n=1 Tax=Nocardioides sp. cx-173 TaxID=2898796 RepID=UPI001E515253|nr:hypothetical protein [Nocardioides sp. cx-173]MCD4525154.1 hypothetical protein [Nocardioides sp. cx-173]UGB40145.1 hypothetical protein LQ940_12135 [Nocardioides sp. cx-173]